MDRPLHFGELRVKEGMSARESNSICSSEWFIRVLLTERRWDLNSMSVAKAHTIF